MQLSRWSKFTFRSGKVARNRLVVPPMASQSADTHGLATAETIAHYKRLTTSGAGIIFVEYSYVHKSGKSEDRQLGAHTEASIDGLGAIATTIHKSGALSGLQLSHAAGKTMREFTGSTLMSPSGITVPVIGWQPDESVAMNEQQIQNWGTWFSTAALRAERAGFDFVEIHAAHGYGLNQWLSPITNHRDDIYGGDIEARAKLLFEIVAQIKLVAPSLDIAVRLPAQDYFEGGLRTEEMKWVVARLEQLGVSLIDVSSGIGGWRRPEGRIGEGYLINDASHMKSATQLPVIGVGGISTPRFIDEVVSSGLVDFAAVGRSILKTPQNWLNACVGNEATCSS